MPYNMILNFQLPYFHVSITALFFTQYFSTLILYRRSRRQQCRGQLVPRSARANIDAVLNYSLAGCLYWAIKSYMVLRLGPRKLQIIKSPYLGSKKYTEL